MWYFILNMPLLININILKHIMVTALEVEHWWTGAGSLFRYLSAYWNVGVEKHDL